MLPRQHCASHIAVICANISLRKSQIGSADAVHRGEEGARETGAEFLRLVRALASRG